MAGGLRSAIRGTSAVDAEPSMCSDLGWRIEKGERAAFRVALRHPLAADRPRQRCRIAMIRADKACTPRLKTVEISLMMRPCAWLRLKGRQRWDETRCPGPRSSRLGMYFRTVLGDTRRPNLGFFAQPPEKVYSRKIRLA